MYVDIEKPYCNWAGRLATARCIFRALCFDILGWKLMLNQFIYSVTSSSPDNDKDWLKCLWKFSVFSFAAVWMFATDRSLYILSTPCEVLVVVKQFEGIEAKIKTFWKHHGGLRVIFIQKPQQRSICVFVKWWLNVFFTA